MTPSAKAAPPPEPPVTATATLKLPSWLKPAAAKVVGSFVTAFLAVIIAAGAGANIGTLKAAGVAGIAAGLKAIDAVVGNFLSTGETSIAGAVQARRSAT